MRRSACVCIQLSRVRLYEIPAGSAASHEMQERLRGKGIRVYDIEFVTLSQGFAPLPSSCPGRLRGGPGERWRVGRRVASFAHRRNARGRAPNAGAQLCDAVAERPSSNEAIIQEARSDRLLPGRGTLPLCDLLDVLPTETVVSVEVPMDGSPQPSSMCGTYSWRRRSCSPPAAPKTMRIYRVVATERGHLLAQL